MENKTISDINYYGILYSHSQVEHRFLLLYEMCGVSVYIPLPNADLLSFIQPFDKIDDCQNHIDTNDSRRYSLFVYSGNIQTWIDDNTIVPNNLREIIIFCPNSDDQEYFEDWAADRLTQVKNIITYDELDHQSLLAGIKHIKRIRSLFQDDRGFLNLLDEDRRRMCLALTNYFKNKANEGDNHTVVSVEPS